MSTVLLLPTAEYVVGQEYTPEFNPMTIKYFIPVINWSFCSIQMKGWTDDTYDKICSYAVFFREYDNNCTIICADFLINRSNGKITISNVNSIDIGSTGANIYKINNINGVGLQGVLE